MLQKQQNPRCVPLEDHLQKITSITRDIWRILFCFWGLEGLVLYFKKTFINFSIKTVTLLVLLSPNQPRKRPHQRRRQVKPIKLQDAHLTDLTETSSKKGDWVGKETWKAQHTASPQTVQHSHRQRGDQCASTPKKQSSKIIEKF